jgi:hypothetical protein
MRVTHIGTADCVELIHAPRRPRNGGIEAVAMRQSSDCTHVPTAG